jgi:hypothetical protein
LNALHSKEVPLIVLRAIQTLSTLRYMTTLILLTPSPGGLDYDLDQNSNYLSTIDKVLMSTAGPANLFG